MKKLIALALALTLALTLAACGGDTPAETTAPAAPQVNAPTLPDPASWKYTVQGVDIMMHAPAAPILEALGEPVSYTEEASCAFTGLQDLLLRRLLPADLPPGRCRLHLQRLAG